MKKIIYQKSDVLLINFKHKNQNHKIKNKNQSQRKSRLKGFSIESTQYD